MRNRIASAALAGAATLAAVAAPTTAVAATPHPVITRVSVTDMAMGLTLTLWVDQNALVDPRTTG